MWTVKKLFPDHTWTPRLKFLTFFALRGTVSDLQGNFKKRHWITPNCLWHPHSQYIYSSPKSVSNSNSCIFRSLLLYCGVLGSGVHLREIKLPGENWTAELQRLPLGCTCHLGQVSPWSPAACSGSQLYAVRVTRRLLGYAPCLYSGPSILRPPMGPRKCSLILQGILKQRSFNTESCPLGPNQAVLKSRVDLK